MELFICQNPIKYTDAMQWFTHTTREKIFVLEHEDIYTAGKSTGSTQQQTTTTNNIHGIKAIHTERGGLWTWHGKGQIVVYFIYNIKKRNLTISDFLSKIENIVVKNIKQELHKYNKQTNFKIFADPNKRGFWFYNNNTKQNEKLGFIGLRVSKGCVLHGISINYTNNLTWFDFIDPCGLGNVKITSIQEILDKSTNTTTDDKKKTLLDINNFKLSLGASLLKELKNFKNEKK